MKVLGLFLVIVIVIIGYCVYNPVVVDSADFTNAQKGKSSSSACKGPFGFDSQKALNDLPSDSPPLSKYDYGELAEIKYLIDVVSDIDLEKNDDGTWYVANCELYDTTRTLHFKYPYPQQNELKKGDIIGFKALAVRLSAGVHRYFRAEILEHLSSQSADCKIDGIRQLTKPVREFPYPSTQKNFVSVTGVVMAVVLMENEDPEPDDPSDYHIVQALMKCADGNLYIADFRSHRVVEKYYPDEKPRKFPSQDAFGEGDIITVMQTGSIWPNLFTRSPGLSFPAYYEQK